MDETKRDQFVERLFNSGLAMMDMLTIHIGSRLGLYDALGAGEALTVEDVAARSGVRERYAREWLEQQATTGILDADISSIPVRFLLSEEHREVLLDEVSLSYLAPMARMLAAIAGQTPRLIDVFRDGGGLSWEAYGADVIEGQAQFNRPAFVHQLAQEWLPAIPSVHARLQQPDARIADIGCGVGWSTIAMAEGYAHATVDGFDLDDHSVRLAREEAARRDLSGRVAFNLTDISDGTVDGQYDLVTVFEALHDMARPIEALRSMRALCRDGGRVLVMDERVAPEFAGSGDDIERLMYGWSVLLCLTNSMAETPSAATGTAIRESTVRAYASDAGFSSVEALGIENDFFRFYLLMP